MKTEGDMDLIMDSIPCSTPQDEERFTDIIKELIQNDKVPDYKKFSKETKKKKQARKRRVSETCFLINLSLSLSPQQATLVQSKQ